MKHNEKEFVDLIEKIFNNEGYKTQREVIPDECKTWKFPWRIDLIVFYDSEIFGIEAKHINTLGQGSKLAQAFKQIQKYKKCKINGKIIDKWFIAPKFNSHLEDSKLNSESHIAMKFIQNFLMYLDIGFIYLEKQFPSYFQLSNIKINFISKYSKFEKEFSSGTVQNIFLENNDKIVLWNTDDHSKFRNHYLNADYLRFDEIKNNFVVTSQTTCYFSCNKTGQSIKKQMYQEFSLNIKNKKFKAYFKFKEY